MGPQCKIGVELPSACIRVSTELGHYQQLSLKSSIICGVTVVMCDERVITIYI